MIRVNRPPGVFIHLESTMRMGYVTDAAGENSVLINGVGGANPTLPTQSVATRMAEKLVERYF